MSTSATFIVTTVGIAEPLLEGLSASLRISGIQTQLVSVASVEQLGDVPPDLLVLGGQGVPKIPFEGSSTIIVLEDWNLAAAESWLALPGVISALPAASVVGLSATVGSLLPVLSSKLEAEALRIGLELSESRYQAFLNALRNPVTFVHQGAHVFANKAYLDMMGFVSLEDMDAITFLDAVSEDSADTVKRVLKESGKGQLPAVPVDLEFQGEGGQMKPFSAEFSQATYAGEDCLQVSLYQRSEEVEVPAPVSVEPENVVSAATVSQDPVTGLLNREGFMQALTETDVEGQACLLLLELDNYLELVGKVGIFGMDSVIRQLAENIGQWVGSSGRLARIGDHLFGILQPSGRFEDMGRVAETIQAGVSATPIRVDDLSFTVSLSAGVGLRGEGESMPHLFQETEKMLRVAEAKGGNGVAIRDPLASRKQEAREQQQAIESIRSALASASIHFFYQKIMSLSDNSSQWFEVFTRMNAGWVSPSPYDLLIKQPDTLVGGDLDKWVLSRVVADISNIAVSLRPTLLVSLSSSSVSDPTFLTWLASLLKQHAVSTESLLLVVSEKETTTNLVPLSALVTRWGQLGGKVMLDGLADDPRQSAALSHVPVDFLRIDRKLTEGLAENPALASTLNDLCSEMISLGKTIMVRGVDTVDDIERVYASGATLLQGEAIAAPSAVLSLG